MQYILRMKKSAYNSALRKAGVVIDVDLEPPYFAEGGGTPKEEDATRFSSKKEAGEAFDQSGVGRREDYECLTAAGGYRKFVNKQKPLEGYKLKF